jgi:hypothetical protein
VAPAGCRQVSFFFAPQHQVQISYVISAVAAAVLLLLLLIAGLRRRGRRTVDEPPPLLPEEHPGAMPLPRAAAVALLIAVAVGWIFALRVGAISFPVLAFVLWRGYGAAALTWIAVFLLGVVVPIVYLIAVPGNEGGYNFAYATRLIGAHWIGVAGVVLLALACWRMIAAARSGHGVPSPASPLDEGEQHPVGAVEQEVVRS